MSKKQVNYAEDESTEEDADFSASEDEWNPNEGEADSSDGESDVQEEDDDFEPQSKVKATKSKSKTPSSSRRRSLNKSKTTIASLRHRMFNKYKPPPRTLSSPKPLNKSISKILESSHYQQKKSITSTQDSDSSGDDYLVKPHEIDLKSSFFDVVAKTNTEEDVPNFDCNAGMQLSDSEEEMDVVKSASTSPQKMNDQEKSTANMIMGINQNSSAQIDFHKLIQYNKVAKETEDKMRKIKTTTFQKDDDINVSKLLALGEGCSTTTVSQSENHQQKITGPKKRKKANNAGGSDSESDWEQVQDDCSPLLAPIVNDLQINIPLPQATAQKKREAAEIEMMIKRKLNRNIKENQLYFHKISLLCHIAHGTHCNRILNSPTLMTAALKLLPNKTCYPDGPTCVKYFEAITKWYKSTVSLRKDQMHLGTKTRPPMGVSLAFQIKYKEALCKKDFVLIFIILLRAMGIPCRLVINLIPLPLKPPASNLHSLSTKADKKIDVKTDSKNISRNLKIKKTEKHSNANSTNAKQDVKTDEGHKLSQKRSETKEKHSEAKPISTSTKKREESVDIHKSSHQRLEKVVKHSKANSTSTKKYSKSHDSQKESHQQLQSDKEIKKLKNAEHKKVKSAETVTSNKMDSEKVTGKTDKVKTPSIAARTRNSRKQLNQETRPDLANRIVAETVLPKIEVNSKKPMQTKDIEKSVKTSNHLAGPSKAYTETKSIISEPLKNVPTEDNLETCSKIDHAKDSNICKTKESETTEARTHFVEIKKNVGAKRLKLGPNSKDYSKEDIAESAASNQKDAKKSMFFKIPVVKNGVPTESSAPSTSQQSNNSKSIFFKPPNAKDDSLKDSSAPSTSRTKDKTKSLYFQLPTKRTTRAASKLKAAISDDLKIPQMDGADDIRINLKKLKSKSRDPPSNSDDDFVPSPPKKVRPNKLRPSTSSSTSRKDRRVLSTDIEDEAKPNKKMDIWIEVYSEKEGKWMAINLFKSEVDNVENIRKSATTPVSYVFAWNNDNTLKDVSPRYCPTWNTATRKQRVDKEWLDIAIKDFLGRRTRRSKAEDVEFLRMHLDKPLPSTISEYKNHPLYALQRHLLKFEAIYPQDALTLGFVRGEPVYARDCVHTCHSRDIWLKEARVVRPGEQPYKIVKARPKWDKFTNTVIKDLPLEIFGHWQTMEYDPPTAENGIVPRNAYGNVDLFKPCMLPKKTKHLPLPGLNRVCKKLKIDCAPAVVGFDFHQGSCHPMIDGYVVCEEFAEIVTDAWTKDQEDAERREDEKYYQRVYGNWKKLIRGLYIRERLKIKYNFQGMASEDKPKKKRRGK